MRLHEITEGLDSNQRRVGQVGAEERANKVSPVLGSKDKQHPYKGRLVGENETVDEASLATMRDYFAGNKDAQDEMEITKQRKYFDELKRKEEAELKRRAALQRGVATRIGGSKLGEVTGLSPDLLARYKKAAGADATAADKEGDIARGNKRFSGIVRATKKEFDNDLKKK